MSTTTNSTNSTSSTTNTTPSTNSSIDTPLPSKDSPSLILTHPTPAEQHTQWLANGAHWRGALSLPAYLTREDFLLRTPLATNGGLTHWVLVEPSSSTTSNSASDDSGKQRRVLAGCETLRKKALIARNGNVEDVLSHGVGSVFSEYRGKGYGGRMMQELGRVLKTWQADGEGEGKGKVGFSVLYSDIGKRFYAEKGWEAFPSAHVSLPAMEKGSSRRRREGLPEVKPLRAEDLAELCKVDEKLMREGMARVSKRSGKTLVALVPDVETIQWHHAREDFVAKELLGRVPEVKGGIVGTERGKRVFAYWTRMWYNENPKETKGNTLHILRLVVEDQVAVDWEGEDGNDVQVNGDASRYEAAIAALLAAAQEQAARWNMEHVEIWNPTAMAVRGAQLLDPNAEVIHRDRESIASLMWYGDNTGTAIDSVTWIGNEKYGWC